VRLDELHDAVGKRIANLIGCEAAMVTAGAASALTLATAACLTGLDREKVRRLPDTTGMKQEVIIQKSHRYAALLQHQRTCRPHQGGRVRCFGEAAWRSDSERHRRGRAAAKQPLTLDPTGVRSGGGFGWKRLARSAKLRAPVWARRSDAGCPLERPAQ